MDVGVRELKAKLSEYLDRAAAGETIRVTDRGKPKATLGPPIENPLERGIREGWIRPGNGKRRLLTKPTAKPRRPTAEIIAEDRGE